MNRSCYQCIGTVSTGVYKGIMENYMQRKLKMKWQLVSECVYGL